MQLRLDTDIESARKSLTRIQRRVLPKATVRALNKTASQAKTAGVRAISQRYAVKQKAVRGAVVIYRARGNRLQADVVATGENLPLIAFNPRQTKKGLSVRIKKQTGRKTIRGAFIATMKSGHRGAYMRRGRKRLPIDELYTVSVPRLFVGRSVYPVIARTIRERFPVVLGQEIQFGLIREGLA